MVSGLCALKFRLFGGAGDEYGGRVRPGDEECLTEEIAGDRQAMLAVGGEPPNAAMRHRADAVAPHQSFNAATSNLARRLKTLNGITPYGSIRKRWTTAPKCFPSTRSIKCREKHLHRSILDATE